MTTKEKVLNIHQRLNLIMGDVDYIKKNKSIKIGGGGYSVVGHDSVTALIHPLLVKYGVTLIPSITEVLQEGNRTSVKMEFSWINIDDPKDCVINCCAGYGIDQQDKGIGKAISYAQKNIILKTLHIETGERDIEEDDIDFINEPLTPSLTLSETDKIGLKEFVKKPINKKTEPTLSVDQRREFVEHVSTSGISFPIAVELIQAHGYAKTDDIPVSKLESLKDEIASLGKGVPA